MEVFEVVLELGEGGVRAGYWVGGSNGEASGAGGLGEVEVFEFRG